MRTAIYELESFADELDELEREIIPPDDREPVMDTLEVPYRWICRLELNFGPDPRKAKGDLRSIGTGTLISPQHVLTAGHSLYKKFRLKVKGKKKRLVFVRKVRQVRVTPGYSCLAPAAALLGQSNSSRTVTHPNWNPDWSTLQESRFRRQFDYGLITLDSALGSQRRKALGNRPLGYWGDRKYGEGTRLRPKDPNFLNGLPINISGYPGDKCCLKPKPKGKRCRPARLFATAQFRCFGDVTDSKPAIANRLIFYDLDTVPGHSGSPVWLRWKQYRNLIAIHTGPAWPIDESLRKQANRGVRITDEVVRQIQAWM